MIKRTLGVIFVLVLSSSSAISAVMVNDEWNPSDAAACSIARGQAEDRVFNKCYSRGGVKVGRHIGCEVKDVSSAFGKKMFKATYTIEYECYK
jgi:hypothetical protein